MESGLDIDRMKPAETPTKFQPQVTLLQKFAYGFGASADMIGFHAPAALIMPIYTLALGVSPALVGLAIGITRVWDAFLDPVMGSISDKTRSQFGRRRPYIFSGAIIGGITFALMWQIPMGWSATAYFTLLTASLILFYTAFTVFTVPYHAIGYEMTSDYHERTSVMSYRMFFNMIGNICAGWLLAGTQLEFFDSTLHGARFIGPVTGLVFILFGLAPVFFIKERAEVQTSATKKQLPIFQSLFATLKDKNFRLLIVLTVLMLSGWTFATSIIVFINISYVFPGDLKASSILLGSMGMAQTAVVVIALMVATRVSKKVGKKAILKFSFSIQILHVLSAWFLITPNYPYLQIVAYMIGAIANMTFFLMLHSMTSDICDQDEWENGTRREGMYGAVITWMQKLCVSIAVALVGVVLVAVGFDQTEGAIQTSQTALSLRLIYCGIFLTIGTVGLLLLPRYSLTEERILNIQSDLAKRREGLDQD